ASDRDLWPRVQMAGNTLHGNPDSTGRHSFVMAGRVVQHCISTFCSPEVPPSPLAMELPELILKGELPAVIEFLLTPIYCLLQCRSSVASPHVDPPKPPLYRPFSPMSQKYDVLRG